MNAWIYFVLISELMWSLASLVDKVMFSKNYIKSPIVFLVFNGLANALLILLLPFFSFGRLSLMDLAASILAGIFLSIGVFFYYKAVKHEEISRVLMLWQLIPLFVLAISFLFLDEKLPPYHLFGFLLLFAAGIIVSYRKINGSLKLSKAFYYMLASTILISVYYILSKHIYNVTNFWSAFMWLRLSAFVPLLLLLLPSIRTQFARTFKNMKGRIKGLIISKMIMDFSAFIILGLAMVDGPISLISALGSSTAPVFIFAITLWVSLYFPKLIKENIDKKAILIKILAIALIITGIIFVNL